MVVVVVVVVAMVVVVVGLVMVIMVGDGGGDGGGDGDGHVELEEGDHHHNHHHHPTPHPTPGLPAGNVAPRDFPSQVGGNAYYDFVIEDTLRVPLNITPGDYVLGWRWDAEMTSQIWQSCSDITIV